PSIWAKRVKSRPTPTFLQGCHFVPHCLTRMLPAVTNWPAVAFSPRRCERESRPLRVEPCPFLCAMTCLLSCYNFFNFHSGVFLAVTNGASVVFALFVFEGNDFRTLRRLKYFCFDRA